MAKPKKNYHEIAEDKRRLKEWFKTIPPCDIYKVHALISEECMVTLACLNNWRYGRNGIPLTGKRDLNKVALRYRGEKIFDEVGPEIAVEA